MDPDRISRLTDQQRNCLRYVYAHMTSKEIAPLLGIEPNSVDQHIKAAMRVLGVSDRRAAARILADHEARKDAQPLVYQPADIATAPDPATLGRPIESGRQSSDRWTGAAMREEQASFKIVAPGGAPAFPLPIGDTRPGDLGWAARLIWILAITIGIALAFGGLVSGVDGLVTLLRR